MPVAEIFEHADEIVVILEVPAAAAEAISVTVERDLLVVTSRDEPPYHSEVVLPCAVDADRMQIAYEGGVLRISLPRAR